MYTIIIIIVIFSIHFEPTLTHSTQSVPSTPSSSFESNKLGESKSYLVSGELQNEKRRYGEVTMRKNGHDYG